MNFKYFILIVHFVFSALSLFAQEKEDEKLVYVKNQSLLSIEIGGSAHSYGPDIQFYLKDSVLNDPLFYYDIKKCTSEQWIKYNNNFPELIKKDPWGRWSAHVIVDDIADIYIDRYMFTAKDKRTSYESGYFLLTPRLIYNKEEVRGYFKPISYILYEKKHLKKELDSGKEIVATIEDLQYLFKQKENADSAYSYALNGGYCALIKNPINVDLNIVDWRIDSSINVWNDSKLEKVNALLLQSSQPLKGRTLITDTIRMVRANIPIMLVDEKNHKIRADSDDWRIFTHLNAFNGDFFQYFFFEKELDYEWPLYVREFAMDHLAGAHICKKSTVLVNKKSHEKVFKQGHMRGNNPKDVYISKTKGRQWRPAPVPENKNTIPGNRLYNKDRPWRIFGSYAKVWELDVWQMLPNMLRDNPEGVYLVGYGTLLHLNECKTPYEEQTLLKKCGVLITPRIYKELQSLRRLEQSQSPSTKK